MSLKIQLNLSKDNFTLAIDTQIATQGISGIFGESGCGKTTLLRCIAGLENTLQGKISFNEEVWQNDTQNTPVEKRAIGFVFQESNLLPHLNVRQNLNYGFKRSLKRINKQQPTFEFDEVVELLGLKHLLQQNSGLLSGGEKQRVAIARAILSHPKILLMDEPLAALDKKSKQEILPYLEKLHQQLQIPIIYVSHSEEEIARLADHLIVLQQGKIIAQGEVLELFSQLDSPLAQADDCSALIDCVVSQINREFHLAQLSFDGCKIRLPAQHLTVGQKVRLRVSAKDVSVCLQPPQDSSILNILAATIIDIKPDSEGQCLLQLKLADCYLRARLSEFSRQQLQLHTGQQVYAQIKAMALIK